MAATSFRITDEAKAALRRRAASEQTSVTALLERLIIEGVRGSDHPGIVFRGPEGQRRAALAAGPDVWEIVARLRELEGSTESRIERLAEESQLHPRMIRAALDYAAEHADEVRAQIERNENAIERSQRIAEQRRALLA